MNHNSNPTEDCFCPRSYVLLVMSAISEYAPWLGWTCARQLQSIVLTYPRQWSAAALAGCTTAVAIGATVQPLGLQSICMCMLNGCHAQCKVMLHHCNVVALHAMLQCCRLGWHEFACSTGSMPEVVGPLHCT